MPAANLVDCTFGRLTVISRNGSDTRGHALWLCKCECLTEIVVPAARLVHGKTRSCGCLAIELKKDRATSHGMCGTPEYATWQSMRSRCERETHKDYPNYGGRGIKVCKRWKKFDAFLKDMGCRPSLRHTIERINNRLGYSPSNCRWSTRKEQNRNRRSNSRITLDGRTLCLSEWAELLGVPAKRIQSRLSLGWSPKRALTEPLNADKVRYEYR